MKERLAALLACPDCGGDLVLRATQRSADDVEEGSLECACGKSWPIRGGVPRFVPDDAYVGSFSYQWNVHARTQFDDASRRESWDTFREKTGFSEDDVRGRVVLEAGCGSGRFLDVVDRMGASETIGIDLSLATEAAWRNLSARKSVHVIQADVFHLPFRPGTFDVACSIGVLHHTPDTKAAFLKLPPLLKPSGKIAIWLYDEYYTAGKITDAYRKVTTKLPRRLLHAACAVSVPWYWLTRIPVAGRVLRFVLPMSSHPDWRWRWLDTFDWYSPTYQWKHRYPEVCGWFREAGLRDVEVLEPPVAVRGRKP